MKNPQPNLFGTDGIRNRVDQFPLTQEALPQLGKAIAEWALQKYGPKVKILIAQDTRESCGRVQHALCLGLLSSPISIYYAHVLPTPALSHIMEQFSEYNCAIMISASHNSYQDNGIKIIDGKTGKLTIKDETLISEYFYGHGTVPSEYQAHGTAHILSESQEIYTQKLSSYFPKQIFLNKHIVLDTAHGATYQVAPQIFRLLGAQVTVINNQPNGININENCGSLHTEQLSETVKQLKADMGFAFDGDGDRVIAVNGQGEIKNGDDLLAILTKHPDYALSTTVIGTVMSNQGFEVYLKKQNKKLLRTAVGDKYILEALNQQNLLLGGEQSGHIILKNYINTGDGILVALKVLEALILSGNWLLKTFDKYPQILINVPVKARHDLSLPPFCDLIAQTQKNLLDGRLLVRYSGTESLLRIMVEELDEQYALAHAQQLAQQLEQKLV